MSIVNFTPFSAIIGGVLIGLAAALLWWTLGRIAGVSNILGGVLTEPGGDDSVWRIAFLAGLVVSGFGAMLLVPDAVHFELKAGSGQLLVAGLLVGFGTQMGSGCTSGHGLCGIGRLSIRSVVATLCFMGSGMLTVFALERL